MVTTMTDLLTAHERYCRAASLADNTITDRMRILRRINEDLPLGLEQATTEELAHWLSGGDEGVRWSPQTKATYYGHLTGFYRWACDPRNPILDYDPSLALARPHVKKRAPRPVSDTEAGYVLNHTVGFWRLASHLAAYAGLRAHECAKVNREDITPETITILGKGGVDAVLPTHPAIWELVEPLPAGNLAVLLHGRYVSGGYVSAQYGVYLRKYHKRKGITLHRLRHWYATNLLKLGADLRTVQELMRHADPGTTAIYTQITDRQRQMAIAALPTLAPASA
jgi:integrase